MEYPEHAGRLPLSEPVVTGRRAPELLRDRVPLATSPSSVHDAVEHQPVVNTRSAASGAPRTRWNQRGDDLPDLVGNTQELAFHAQ
jgi:hypothetical protein